VQAFVAILAMLTRFPLKTMAQNPIFRTAIEAQSSGIDISA